MEMYYQKSWKTTKEVNEKSDSLNSESAKKEAVKEQIKMRTDGIGGKELVIIHGPKREKLMLQMY